MTRFAATAPRGSLLKPVVDMSGWLGLAAAPTFALMALVSALGAPAMCAVASPLAPISDMALMYLLMGLFHLPPWLRLLSARAQRTDTQTEGD